MPQPRKGGPLVSIYKQARVGPDQNSVQGSALGPNSGLQGSLTA